MGRAGTAGRARALSLTGLLCLLQACGPRDSASPDPRPDDRPHVRVMTYNLGRYALADRNGDGQKDDPKPDAEKAAAVREMARLTPDICALQGLGRPEELADLVARLREHGLTYEFREYLREPASAHNLAVLSRYPVVAVQHHQDLQYSVRGEPLEPVPGFIDVDIGISPTYRMKLLVAHLKDKTYHRLGQTEMRRNEARILNQIVRDVLERDPEANILVAGTFHDDVQSGAIRTLTGESPRLLHPVAVSDRFGARWTYRSPEPDRYVRADYLFVNDRMRPELVPARCTLGLSSNTLAASPHRPVLAVFEAINRPAGP